VKIEVMDITTWCKRAVHGSPLRVLTIVTIVIVAWCWTVTTLDHKAVDEPDQQHEKISDGEDAWLFSLTR
jgi:hypothetical protein